MDDELYLTDFDLIKLFERSDHKRYLHGEWLLEDPASDDGKSVLSDAEELDDETIAAINL